MEYKIEQLEKMLEAETDPETSGYGALLKHWAGTAEEITIDAAALRVLLEHYKARAGKK